MAPEKMNVHLALAELKMLDKRIDDAIREGNWIIANKHSNTKIGGVNLTEIVDNMKSRHQKVNDLIRRRDAIKRAVVLSNATTKVVIGGVEYTVAEAIDMKNHGIVYLGRLMNRFATEYGVAKNTADRANGPELERRADDYVRTMVGNGDTKGMTDEIKRMREDFIKAQTVELVDPIGLQKEIERLDKQINEFTVNVDAALSVSNATTEIKVEY